VETKREVTFCQCICYETPARASRATLHRSWYCGVAYCMSGILSSGVFCELR